MEKLFGKIASFLKKFYSPINKEESMKKQPILESIRWRMNNLRDFLIQEDKENNKKNGKITDWFSQLGSKYKFDVLVEDLNIILWHIRFSLESVKENYPLISEVSIPYYPQQYDNKFWYWVDCWIRSLSCWWDRLGLFLNLAFESKLKKCSFYGIIQHINKQEKYKDNEHFKKLLHFSDNEFKFLQWKIWEWYRNESIHSLTLWTRFWFEMMENYNWKVIRPLYWHDKIIEHDKLLREWIENTFLFIESIDLQ